MWGWRHTNTRSIFTQVKGDVCLWMELIACVANRGFFLLSLFDTSVVIYFSSTPVTTETEKQGDKLALPAIVYFGAASDKLQYLLTHKPSPLHDLIWNLEGIHSKRSRVILNVCRKIFCTSDRSWLQVWHPIFTQEAILKPLIAVCIFLSPWQHSGHII